MPYCENKGEIVTFQEFYTRFNSTDSWNSLDAKLINTDLYPKGQKMVTSKLDEVSLGTAEEPIITNGYDMFRYSPIGKGIEAFVINDEINRCVEAGIYVKP